MDAGKKLSSVVTKIFDISLVSVSQILFQSA